MERNKIKVFSIWNKDNNQIMLLFFISILVVYYLPFRLNQLIFFIFIFLAYRSKKDYLWIAFFLILIDAPGRLFQGGLITDIHRIAFYPIIPGITLRFEELFTFMYIFKSIDLKRKFPFIFKKDFFFLFFFTLFVLIYSLILGMSSSTMVYIFRMLISWSFIYVIVKLFTKEFDFDKLNRLLFPMVFLALISQIYSYLTGNYIGRFLKGASFRADLLMISADSEKVARAADSSIILLYCFTMALFYMFLKRQVFSRRYLYLIIVISMFSVFLSATRGYIIAFFFSYLTAFFMVRKSTKMKYFVRIGIFALIVITIVSFFFPLIKAQMNKVTDRALTMVSLVEGDITARGTLSRLDIRGPQVMKKFYESSLLGWGFSDEYFKYRDGHVGHQNILLNVGIIGYIILNFFYFKWCIRIYLFARTEQAKENYGKNTIKILCFAFVAMYIIHSSSAQSWGFDIGISKILFYSLLFAFFNIIYRNTALLHNEGNR